MVYLLILVEEISPSNQTVSQEAAVALSERVSPG